MWSWDPLRVNFVDFLSMENRKGWDYFDVERFGMFRALFRNFGDTFLGNSAPISRDGWNGVAGGGHQGRQALGRGQGTDLLAKKCENVCRVTA